MNARSEEQKTMLPPVIGVRHDAIPLLIAYDISEDRRRNSLHRLLRGFGDPVQRSVFLCWVDPRRRRRLETLLGDFLRSPDKGSERVDCFPARADGLSTATQSEAWVFE
jgi:CRISPR-associated endonuclease Cas2